MRSLIVLTADGGILTKCVEIDLNIMSTHTRRNDKKIKVMNGRVIAIIMDIVSLQNRMQYEGSCTPGIIN